MTLDKSTVLVAVVFFRLTQHNKKMCYLAWNVCINLSGNNVSLLITLNSPIATK